MRRSDRLFRIVQMLRSGRLKTASALAERLQVSERTIYRDVRDLQLVLIAHVCKILTVGRSLRDRGHRLRIEPCVQGLMPASPEDTNFGVPRGLWRGDDRADRQHRRDQDHSSVQPDRGTGRFFGFLFGFFFRISAYTRDVGEEFRVVFCLLAFGRGSIRRLSRRRFCRCFAVRRCGRIRRHVIEADNFRLRWRRCS